MGFAGSFLQQRLSQVYPADSQGRNGAGTPGQEDWHLPPWLETQTLHLLTCYTKQKNPSLMHFQTAPQVGAACWMN